MQRSALPCSDWSKGRGRDEARRYGIMRIDAERILIKATFDGSACWSVEPAGLAEPRGTIVAVHLPTVSTAEICTMQIVPVSTEQVIEAPEPVIDLDVSALDPENNRVAHGVIEATEGQADCLAPRG